MPVADTPSRSNQDVYPPFTVSRSSTMTIIGSAVPRKRSPGACIECVTRRAAVPHTQRNTFTQNV